MEITSVALREQVPDKEAFVELRPLPTGQFEAYALARADDEISTDHGIYESRFAAEIGAREWAAALGVVRLYVVQRVMREI